jgi:hypothetical protein
MRGEACSGEGLINVDKTYVFAFLPLTPYPLLITVS